MAVLDPTIRPKPKFVDKEWLREMMNEHDAQAGFVPVPGATAEQAQQASEAHLRYLGIDPESTSLFSRAIIEMREEE